MTNLESDELLRQISGQLGEIQSVLAERLPKPVEVKIEPPVANGAKHAVVTGEGAGEGPSLVAARKAPAKRPAAKH